MRAISLIAIAAIVLVALFAGCSSSRTVSTPGGDVTVTEKGGEAKTVEVTTGEGKAVVTTEKKTVTEEELGVPVYPGATAEMTSSYEGMPGQEGMAQHTMLVTSDPFDKVSAFYKANLKNVQSSMTHDMGEGTMSMFALKGADGSEIAVNITSDKEKNVTHIQVVKTKAAK
jgi:hypothetical protein